MDIGREVRRFRAEPVISPVPGAEPPVEDAAAERVVMPATADTAPVEVAENDEVGATATR